jgi:hypothetical protein
MTGLVADISLETDENTVTRKKIFPHRHLLARLT